MLNRNLSAQQKWIKNTSWPLEGEKINLFRSTPGTSAAIRAINPIRYM